MKHLDRLPFAALFGVSALLVAAAALTASAVFGTSGSALTQGDLDCNGSISIRDNQALLRAVLQQGALSQTEPCPDIGTEIPLGPTPVPTASPISGYTFRFPQFYADPDVFEGTVTSTQFDDTIPGGQFSDPVTAPNGARFAIVFIDVTNIASEPHYAGSYSIRLTDALDRSFSLSFDQSAAAASNAEELYDRLGTFDTIQPGIPAEMVFVFQVPDDADDLTASRCPDDGSGC